MIGQKVAYQYLPADWTDDDMRQAQEDLRAFFETKGYIWMANFVGCRQRLAQENMYPGVPGNQPHGMFIEGASRFDEMQQLMNAFKYLDDWRAAKDGKEDK